MSRYDGPVEVAVVTGGNQQSYTLSATADMVLQSLAIAASGYSQISAQMVGLAVAGHARNGATVKREGDALALIRLVLDRLNDRFEAMTDEEEIAVATVVMATELGGRHRWAS